MNPAPQNFTFISRTAPYGSDRPRLCLDAALAAAVFEQQVNYVFMEDGVLQLLKGQDAGNIGSKTLGNALETIDLYGIENVYVSGESLAKRNLNVEDFVIKVQLAEPEAIAGLLRQADVVFNL